MPVTYSFVTLPAIETGPEFDCARISGAAMLGLFYFDEVTPSRGAPYFSIDGNNDLVMYSDDGILSQLLFEFPLEETHTFETVLTTEQIPNSLSDLDQYRFFIGTYDRQDNASGVLISKDGIALVAYYGASAMVLPGSQGIFTEGERYTLRLVVDGSQNLMHLYVTLTSQLATTGHILRYTSAAPESIVGELDSIRIEILGQATRPIIGKFSAFNIACTTAVVPNQRPIADAGVDQTANVGSAIVHDGRSSYDPEGEVLTYDWKLKDAPDGSRFKSDGTGGSTADDGDADGFTDLFNGGTGAFDELNMPLLQPGDHLLVGNVYYKVDTARWLLDATTSQYTRDTGGLWDDDEIVVTTDTIPDALSDAVWSVFHSETYFRDREQPFTSAIPDKAGVYMVGLVVNDGDLDSFENEALLNVASTSVALGCVPDVSWIWNYLSDFWNLLEDREMVETVWSGFAQACAAQLLTAWQIDYNKSLLDIQRVFQRRWLDYPTLLDETDPDEATIRIIRGPIFSADLGAGVAVNGKTLQLVLDADSIQTVTFVGTDPMTADQLATQINAEMGFAHSPEPLARVEGTTLVLEYGTLLRIRPGGTANPFLGYSTTEYMNNDLAGDSGAAVSSTRLAAFEAATPSLLDFSEQGIGNTDLLVVAGEGYRVQKVALDEATGLIPRGLTLSDDLPDDTSRAWIVPSIVQSADLHFTNELVAAGDLVRFSVKHSTTGQITEVQCSIVGAKNYRVGFDPQPLLEHYAGVPGDYVTEFLGVKHLKYIPVDDLVVEIPRLQTTIKEPASSLDQNLDFYIETISVESGDVNAIRIKDGTFTLLDPPPDTLWAETTYLDNREAIEANFGRLVNFSVEHLEERTDELDYLSAVRGLWWSYFGGPAVSKVKTGVQILLGLPFSEVAGTVQDIEANFSVTEGRITVVDALNTDVVRTYFYPKIAGLATNDATGDVLAEGDSIAQFHPLSGGVEVADWVQSPDWITPYITQGKFLETDKYFKWLIRADVDTFSLVNVVFAVDFAKKITPHYTTNLFVLLKEMAPTEVNVTDTVSFSLILNLFDTSCPGDFDSYMWDATDESGNWVHEYDSGDSPMPFFDSNRLCPAETIWVYLSMTHAGGPWEFDTVWAYDDGDGDYLPLSGPAPTPPPPPYGPYVGTISYDDSVVAGVYTRGKTIV